MKDKTFINNTLKEKILTRQNEYHRFFKRPFRISHFIYDAYSAAGSSYETTRTIVFLEMPLRNSTTSSTSAIQKVYTLSANTNWNGATLHNAQAQTHKHTQALSPSKRGFVIQYNNASPIFCCFLCRWRLIWLKSLFAWVSDERGVTHTHPHTDFQFHVLCA